MKEFCDDWRDSPSGDESIIKWRQSCESNYAAAPPLEIQRQGSFDSLGFGDDEEDFGTNSGCAVVVEGREQSPAKQAAIKGDSNLISFPTWSMGNSQICTKIEDIDCDDCDEGYLALPNILTTLLEDDERPQTDSMEEDAIEMSRHCLYSAQLAQKEKLWDRAPLAL